MYVAEQKSDEIDDLFYHVMICQLLFVCLFVCLFVANKKANNWIANGKWNWMQQGGETMTNALTMLEH